MEKQQSSAQDRRNFKRYATESSTVSIHAGDTTIEGVLRDKSLGGIGVATDSAHGLAFGQQVQIDRLEEDTVTGYVRCIRRDDQQYFINISWDDYADVGGQRYKPVAHYVAFQGSLFVCDLLFDDAGPCKTVRLWDGATFKVAAEDLCSRSIETRKAELSGDDHLGKYISLYHLPPPSQNLIDDILDFEFSF